MCGLASPVDVCVCMFVCAWLWLTGRCMCVNATHRLKQLLQRLQPCSQAPQRPRHQGAAAWAGLCMALCAPTLGERS